MLNRKLIGSLVGTACLMAVAVDAAVVGEWKMNEGAGSDVHDSSGNGYTFSPVGSGSGTGYSWTSTSGGLTAAAGNESYLHATIANNQFTYQVTAEAWIKPTGADTDGSQIISLLNGFALCTVNSGADLRFITYSNETWRDVYADIDALSSHYLYDGNFHHVVGVFDGIRDVNGKINVSLFIDGVLANRNSIATASDVVVGYGAGLTGTDLYMGQNAWLSTITSQNFMGDIYGVRITNVPEPVAVSMLALGGLALLRRRKAF